MPTAQKTAQRKAIVSFLRGNSSHPSAVEIYEAVSRELGALSFATVYNTLALLKKKGLVRELALVHEGRKRYDPDVRPHHHLICEQCGRIVDIHLPFSPIVPAEYLQGFTVREGMMTFYGTCDRCKQDKT
jgi:Fur family peroxide stress response transcriptional regulator